MIISSIVCYIKALQLGLHSGAFAEKRPAGGIIRWDFPQLGMTGLWADSRVWLIISWSGSLNTDEPGPQRGCSLRAASFISSDNITHSPPCESPVFYSLQWSIINCTERKPQYNTKYYGGDGVIWKTKRIVVFKRGSERLQLKTVLVPKKTLLSGKRLCVDSVTALLFWLHTFVGKKIIV